ncbi:hypothetical protein BH10ACT3_BH10ACT3_20980 [soil metagenome]
MSERIPPISSSTSRSPRRSRSVIALAAIAVLALFATVACSSSDEDTASDKGNTDSGSDGAPTDSGEWSFTDDFGNTVTLDEQPTTIVAEATMAGGLWDLGFDAVATFGPMTKSDGSKESSIGMADPADFESLGQAYGEINLEQLAALQPDLVVVPSFEEGTYWGIEGALVQQVEKIAPIVAIEVSKHSITEVLGRVADLGEALGADLDTGEAADAIASFDSSSEQLEAAIAANPGLTVSAASGSADTMYVAVPSGYPDLSYFQSLGLDIVEPKTDEQFWEVLSWEEADKYPVDVILADSRGGTVEQIVSSMPTNAQQLPAVQADQLGLWEVPFAYGYLNFARIMDDLTVIVENAKADIV